MTEDLAAPVWIDTDMGFDDLAAILLVLAHRPVAGLSLVAGNCLLAQVGANACAAAAVFGWEMPILEGAAQPLAGPLVTADYVLGDDGMPGQGRKLPPTDRRPAPGAVAALAAFLDAGGRDVLALGPLTNIAHLVAARPDLAGMRLVWMGGSAGRGNHSAAAEFNAAVDPEAVAAVIAAGVRIEMVDLLACRQVTATLAELAPLRAEPGERAALLADLYEGYLRIADDGARPMALYDPVAAAALVLPGSVACDPARLDMETRGEHTRGMTVVEWRAARAAPNALVSTRADGARIREALMQALIGAARG
ncbi:nucleoside hydrolase [Frigidibacter sp. MR17.24]|uniref:nucleoside hydrolase n=1 Tax=Frigidibacter sp. MR17.24 TaxID=3127345 RepID=UPI003012BBE1